MGTLVWASFATVTFIVSLIVIELRARALQRRRMVELELIPNCLLTRYPLVFITGKRSLFYFLNYWNQVPIFLREHGYEVQVLELPWRNSDSRLLTAKAILQRIEGKCHLLGDSSIEAELNEMKNWNLKSVASVSMVRGEINGNGRAVRAEDLRPKKTELEIFWVPAQTGLAVRAPLLALHNLIFSERIVHSTEIGLIDPGRTFLVERKFLEHAISLAERDARCSS